MKFEFITRSDITDIDMLDNILPQCEAILVHDGIWWIEICKGYFYIPDGCVGYTTASVLEAINYLIKIKIDNS